MSSSKLAMGIKKAVANDLAEEVKLMANKSHNSFVDSKMFQDKLREIFKDTDLDGNGTVSHDEIYTMVLLLYLFVAQYTTINSKTIPSRARVEDLYNVMDADGNGTLDFEEFRAMAIFLVEDMAARIGVQMFVKSILGPILGYIIVELVHTYLMFMGVDTHKKMGLYLPSWLYNETMAIAVATALATMFLLPYVVSLIDRVMNIRAANHSSLKQLKDRARKKAKQETEKSEQEAMNRKLRALSKISKFD